MRFSFSSSSSSSASSSKKSIKRVAVNDLQEIEHLLVKRFCFDMRLMKGGETLNIHHAFLVIELEDDKLITVEVTGTSKEGIFVSFSSGGVIASKICNIFYPTSNSLELREIIDFCSNWIKEGKYHFLLRNCYHFVYDILQMFASGNTAIVLAYFQFQRVGAVKNLMEAVRERIQWLAELAKKELSLASFLFVPFLFGFPFQRLDSRLKSSDLRF